MGKKRTPDFYRLPVEGPALEWAREQAKATFDDNRHLTSMDDRLAAVFLAGMIAAQNPQIKELVNG